MKNSLASVLRSSTSDNAIRRPLWKFQVKPLARESRPFCIDCRAINVLTSHLGRSRNLAFPIVDQRIGVGEFGERLRLGETDL